MSTYYERPVDPTTSIMVADVVFRESPDVMFNVCTVRLDILKEVFGADFRTSMVGKAIEVSNVAQATENCRGRLSSISIRLARQIRRAPASRFEPTWRVPVNAPVSREPAPRTAESDARAAAFATSATGIAARAAANAPNAQSIGAGSSAMPFYNLSSEAVNLQIRGYCSEIYSGASPTMAPEILRLRVAQQVAIRAEVQGCVTRVEFAVLASNRKVALRYCFVNNNYVGPGNGDRLSAYDECMNQNDVLSALCTRDLEHRAAYSPNLKGRKCSLDHPDDGEAALLLKGTDEKGSPLVPASTAPGLPAPAATLWPPGILERAMATAARTPRQG